MWNSGIKWQYTCMTARFFNVDGNVIWLFLLVLYVREMWLLKALIIMYGVLLIASFMGYQINDLAKLWNRWRIGKTRPLYNTKANINRFISGI